MCSLDSSLRFYLFLSKDDGLIIDCGNKRIVVNVKYMIVVNSIFYNCLFI